MRYLLLIITALLLSGCGDTTHTVEGEVDLNLNVEGVALLIDAIMPLALVGMNLTALMDDGDTLYCVDGEKPCITAGDARNAVNALAEALDNNN